MSKNKMDEVIDYLMANYYDDVERMAHIKMVQVFAIQGWGDRNMPELVDKIALFNGIEKSYPPKRTLKQRIIRGIGFIMYGG